MNTKKLLPVIFIVLLAIITLAIKNCNKPVTAKTASTTTRQAPTARTPGANNEDNANGGIDRNATDLYFTKHAKCRMKCRQISQQEVKEILEKGSINYNKSNLKDPKGPTYALEGNTDDGQRVRIIFAPKKVHLTVVTVIDLGVEHQCNCD